MSDLARLAWQPDLERRDVEPGRVLDIAFTPMPTRLRNELITRTYGDLAQAMAEVLGTGDATWTTFGQWASHTVGGYLTLPLPVFGDIIARAFADGNRDVFADIGRGYVVFLDTVGAAARTGGDLPAAWAECERRLRRKLFHPPGDPGGGSEGEFWASITDPRLRPAGPHHNQLLVLGFRAYFRALTAPAGSPERSEHILTGNCLLGLHEQRLLSLAISVCFRSSLRTLTTPWASLESRYDWRHRNPGRLRILLEDAWIGVATRRLIGVQLPTGLVKAGADIAPGTNPIVVQRVPLPQEGQARQPLEALDDHELLGKLFTRLDVDGGPARCWNDLHDRMGFIAGLFAAHQRDPIWFDGTGAVIRPEPRTGFEAAFRAQLQAAAPVPPGPSQPSDGEAGCPLPDSRLDELRRAPTHLAPDGTDHPDELDDLDLSDVAEPSTTERAEQLRQDVLDRLAVATRPGDLLDPATCRHARRLFQQWSTVWFMALVFRSLPDSYAAAAGVHVLGRVSDLATDPFRRAGETAFFVVDLLQSDAGWHEGVLEPDGAALRSVVGVRIMHALAARRLLEHGWDSERFGVPFNQEDVLGTALTFGSSPLEMLDQLGIDLDDEARNAMVRFWLGIGFLLGAPHDAVTVATPDGRRPLDHHEAHALSLAIRRRHHARSLDGVRLAEALLEGVADGFPRGFGWLATGLAATLGEQRATALLLITAGEHRRRAELVAAVMGGLLRLRPTRRLVRPLVQAIGRRWIRPFLAQGRTRPYRRPPTPDDLRRLAEEERLPDLWPVGCAGRRGRRRPPGPSGQPAPNRRRLPWRQLPGRRSARRRG